MPHISFPPIELYSHLYERETYLSDGQRRTVTLRKKIKLHGTQGAVRIECDGTVSFQSKAMELTAENDLKQFVSTMSGLAHFWRVSISSKPITFYGEWAGPGIAKGTAIQQTGQKRFFIFAVGVGAVDDPRRPGAIIPEWVITDPTAIKDMMHDEIPSDLVRVLPYAGVPYEFNFASEEALEHTLNELNSQVDRLEIVDPFVKEHFNCEAPGEGYVLMPHATAPGQVSGNEFSRLAFKAKVEKHRVQKQKAPAAPPAPLPASAAEFLDSFVTEPRLDQAIEEAAGGNLDRRYTGKIIAWMTADIQKEAQTEIAALDVAFDRLRSEIANATREMFFSRMVSAPMEA